MMAHKSKKSLIDEFDLCFHSLFFLNRINYPSPSLAVLVMMGSALNRRRKKFPARSHHRSLSVRPMLVLNDQTFNQLRFLFSRLRRFLFSFAFILDVICDLIGDRRALSVFSLSLMISMTEMTMAVKRTNLGLKMMIIVVI